MRQTVKRVVEQQGKRVAGLPTQLTQTRHTRESGTQAIARFTSAEHEARDASQGEDASGTEAVFLM